MFQPTYSHYRTQCFPFSPLHLLRSSVVVHPYFIILYLFVIFRCTERRTKKGSHSDSEWLDPTKRRARYAATHCSLFNFPRHRRNPVCISHATSTQPQRNWGRFTLRDWYFRLTPNIIMLSNLWFLTRWIRRESILFRFCRKCFWLLCLLILNSCWNQWGRIGCKMWKQINLLYLFRKITFQWSVTKPSQCQLCEAAFAHIFIEAFRGYPSIHKNWRKKRNKVTECV